jgi:hypothetical protein
MMIDKPTRPADEGRRVPLPDRSGAAAQTVDDELTEALKGTFPGSDPVALESPLVSRAPKDKRS